MSGPASPAPAPVPVPADGRIDTLDALRGFALGGILLINLTAFANPGGPPGFAADGPWPDRAVFAALILLVESKFFCLFSLLFGVGFSLQLRAEGGFLRRFSRRLLALGGFGAAHILLLWEGDILLLYAVVGFILLLFRRTSPRGLLMWAGGLLAVPLMVYTLLFAGILIARLVPETAAELQRVDAEVTELFRRGREQAVERPPPADFGELVAEHVAGYAETGVLLASRIPTVLAMFLLGLYTGKRGVLTDPDDRLLKRVRGWGLGVGLTLSGLVTLAAFTLPAVSGLAALFFNQAVAGPVLAAGYAAAFLLLARRGGLWLAPLAAVGRMALTNYLTQSLVCSVLFARWGFRLGPLVPPPAQLAVAAGIFAAQVGISVLWLRRFRFGPLEWLWRTLTYGKVQPLRRGRTDGE